MTLQPNELEIYDMSGNVWEWVWDYYSPDYYKQSPKNNPTGPAEPVDINDIKYIGHVLRGGSWGNVPLFLKTTFRFFSLNQILTENVDNINSLWINDFSSSYLNFNLAGQSLYRTRIFSLAKIFENSNINDVSTQVILNKNIFNFSINGTLPEKK